MSTDEKPEEIIRISGPNLLRPVILSDVYKCEAAPDATRAVFSLGTINAQVLARTWATAVTKPGETRAAEYNNFADSFAVVHIVDHVTRFYWWHNGSEGFRTDDWPEIWDFDVQEGFWS